MSKGAIVAQMGIKRANQINYHPNAPWWEPPFSAWVPNANRPVLFVYALFVISLTLLAHFTPFCGTPPPGVQQFCSDNWLFDTDHILKFISAGLFILVAFRGSNSYAKYWEGRCVWGLIWKVSVSRTTSFDQYVCTLMLPCQQQRLFSSCLTLSPPLSNYHTLNRGTWCTSYVVIFTSKL